MENPTRQKNMLLIREKLSPGSSALFGIIPIAALLFLWFLLTLGRSDLVVLPEGLLDEGDPTVQPGRVVKERTYLKIPGGKISRNQGTGERTILYDNASYPLHDLDASEITDGARVKLKTGRFVSRKTVKLSSLLMPPDKVTTPQNDSTPDLGAPAPEKPTPAVGRGGVILPPTPVVPAEKEAILLEFQYEQVETRLINPSILPSPGDVVRSFTSLWYERKLANNVYSSFERVAKGFLVALLFAFPLGVLMGTFSKIKSMFAPLMVFGGYLPIPTLVPLCMALTVALHGSDETQKVMFLALGFVIYLLPLFVRAIEEVDNVYLQTAYTLGANRFQVMIRILLGIAWPNIYDAMRMGFGVGWGYIILAEMVDMGGGGVGALILGSQRIGPREHIYLILVVIVILAFVTDKLWEIFGDLLFPYRTLKR